MTEKEDYVMKYLITFKLPLDNKLTVRSGIKELRLVKTSKATFIGFHRDAFRTLQDLHERVLRYKM